MSAEVGIPILVRLGARSTPTRRLFCMPYAGGGTAPFRLWHRTLPDHLEVMAVQLPGREARLREAPLASIAQMVDAILPDIIRHTDVPYAIFGHSMGALLAYELAGTLEQSVGRGPDRLFVSGRRSPDDVDTRPALHGLPTTDFLVELQARYGAIPAPVLAEAELLDLLVPALRADLQAVETHRTRHDPVRIACPVHVFGGEDDQHPLPSQLDGWARCTVAPVTVRVFPGGHFYLNEQREALTSEIARLWKAEDAVVEAGRP